MSTDFTDAPADPVLPKFIRPAGPAIGLTVFIVPGPEGQARPVPEDFYGPFRFLPDCFQKIFSLGIYAAGQHKITPDKDTQLVTEVEEAGTLIDAAAPDTEHGTIPPRRIPQKQIIIRIGQIGVNGLGGNPVCSPDKEWPPIDDKSEADSVRLMLLLYLHRPDAEGQGTRLQFRAILEQAGSETIEKGFSVGTRPPESGMRNVKRPVCGFLRRTSPGPNGRIPFEQGRLDPAAAGIAPYRDVHRDIRTVIFQRKGADVFVSKPD